MKKNAQSAKSKPKAQISNPQSLRVLMVEDSEDDVLLIIRELKKGGYNPVYERVETEKAMSKALREKPWDIILCAYKLPKFNATSAIALLREINIDIPFLLVSGSIGEETAVECMLSGAQDYIMKNNLSRLCPAIARELEEAEVRNKQKQAESALRESEEKYRNLVERANDGIGIAQDEVFRYVNPQLAQMIGLPVEELIGKPFIDFFFPDEVPIIFERYKQRMMGKKVLPMYETALRHKNGSRIDVEVNAGVITYEGKPADLVFGRDITDRKRAEEAMRKSEENFRHSLGDSPLGVHIVTTEGATIYVNQVVLDIYGYDSIEEINRIPIKERYTPESYAEYKIRKKKRERGELGPSEYGISIVRTNGEIRHLQAFRKEILWNGVKQAQIIYQDITERKNAEDALKNSEEKYRTILENIEDGYYEVDLNGNFTFFNDSMCRILGYPQEEMMGMNNRQFTEKENAKKLFKTFNEVYRTGQPAKEFDWQIIRKDGTKRYIEVSVSLQKNSSGKPIGFRGVARDITERKRLEESLVKEREELKLIIDSSPIIVFYKDKEGRFIRVNRIFAEVLNMPEEYFAGKTVFDLYSPRIAQSMMNDDQEVFQSRRPKLNIIEQYESASGIRWVRTDKIPIFDKDGIPISLIGFAQDITERKLAEEELLQSEAKYRRLVEDAQEGIFQSTAEGHHISVNQAFANILGYESPEEVMATITDIPHQIYVHPDDRTKILQIIEKEGSVKGYEAEFYRKDGSKTWVSINMHAVRDDNGNLLYYQGIDQDITDRKKMEMERQENIERLRKSLGATINAMAVTVETRDPYTAGHQRRVADLARAIATEMNLTSEQIDGVRMASMIHDVGKISIPSEILTKPTQLTALEFNLIKTHSQSGYNILKDIEFPWPVARIVLEHHERINGSGYPNGLKGEQILLESRILAIADVVEAISSHRPYRPAHGINVALDEITKNKGSLYEPDIVDACLRLFREKNYKMAA